MNFQHAQDTAASNKFAASAAGVVYRKRDETPCGEAKESRPGDGKVGRSETTNALFSSLTARTAGKHPRAPSEHNGGRYLGQSKTLKNHCPQRAAELVYLRLLADLQLAHFDKSTAFRDKFAKAFAAVSPTDQHRWMSFFVRCQARLGLKVDRNFNVVCLATASAKSKPSRTKSC